MHTLIRKVLGRSSNSDYDIHITTLKAVQELKKVK